ncbi:hypothetical protein K450DRAFT_257482 [Umbelopsis ramanniana AG]|uniref:Phosphate-induced protein 1 conserved region-domain-containing protein n=1 Tax=Umbelopsis ramanniana AG TaxID=1314678 RepID=A0AAD5E2A4_UMBRA|nr:uncharacterized protein K450DRAFT_257482 [Umbelopsis ramanniana AG]KAI8576268.1 hypothetical protein K450DRAFT_257482 [Umbelopsis ramanniana AG]
MLFKSIAAATAVLGFVASSLAAPAVVPTPFSGIHNKKGIAGLRPANVTTTPTGRASVQITYHGGPIMTGTIKVYPIFYGTWTAAQKTIVNTFISGVSSSTWWNIEKTYHDNSGNYVTGPVTLGTAYADNYSQGKSLSDNSIETIVSHAISAGGLPVDANGIYAVLTAGDVSETSGFCSQYCGWHTDGTISGKDLKYLFAGLATACPSGCIAPNNQKTSPNGDVAVDGMISVLAHEIVEAASDPDLNAWYDASGQENADKCAWTFGTTKTASNGAAYNVVVGGKDYLIQQNWNAATQACALSA